MSDVLQKLQLNSFFVLCCGFILLPACYKKLNKQSAYYYDEQPILKNEAHLSDIPLPVQVTPHTMSGSTQDSTALTFISTFELADLVKFYEFEMERLGWKELHLFSVESEVLLVFEKPQKFCTVSVRPDNRVVIFFGTRS